MKDLESFILESSCDDSELIRIGFGVAGKINITKENPVMKIKIKGTLILDFSGETVNQILELYKDE